MDWLTSSPPPNLILWATVVAAAFPIASRLLDFIQKKSEQKRSVYDELWYRTLIMPECWKPLMDLIGSYVDRLHELDAETEAQQLEHGLRNLCLAFQKDKDNIIGRFVLLKPFNDKMPATIGEALDALEDELTNYCATISMDTETQAHVIPYIESVFWSKLADICSSMMNLHPKSSASVE